MTAHEFLTEKGIRSNKDIINVPQVKEWLKEYAKQLLEEYTDRIVENVKITYISSYTNDKGVDRESITSQLPKFLKEIGI